MKRADTRLAKQLGRLSTEQAQARLARIKPPLSRKRLERVLVKAVESKRQEDSR